VHVRVGFRCVDRRAKGSGDFCGYGVAALRIIHGDEGDVIVDLDQYRIGHGLSLVAEGADGGRVRKAAPSFIAANGGTDANGVTPSRM
jgi:hypothetical protein